MEVDYIFELHLSKQKDSEIVELRVEIFYFRSLLVKCLVFPSSIGVLRSAEQQLEQLNEVVLDNFLFSVANHLR